MKIFQALERAVSKYHDTSYTELKDIVDSCALKITWWGARRVYSTKYTGRISLDRLVDQAMRLSQNNRDFPETDRLHGRAIYHKIHVMVRACCDHDKNISKTRWLFERIVWLSTRIFSRYRITSTPTTTWAAGFESERFHLSTSSQYADAHGYAVPEGHGSHIGAAKRAQYDDYEYWQ